MFVNQRQALARVRRLGGAARYREIGAERHVLARLVGRGELVRIGRGCYAVPGASAAITRAVLLNAVLCCVSALRHHGVDVPGDESVVHCCVPSRRGGHPHRPGTRLHYGEVERDGDVPVATVLDALVAAVRCLAYDDVVALFDLTCDRPGAPTLEEVLDRVAGRSRGMAEALRVDVDTRARSRVETVIRLALRRAGLRVAAGVRIPGVGEVDLLVEGRIVVELDGFAYHGDRTAYRGDRRRDRALLRLGLVPIRFAWEDCTPEIVVEAVRDVLDVVREGALAPHGSTPAWVADQVEWARAQAMRPSGRASGTPPRRRARAREG